jgi:hypothetical protein
MSSPLTLPVARLRATGCKVGHVVGHDPITTSAHPNFTGKWQFSITTPEPVGDLSERLNRWDNEWTETVGNAVAYVFRDGRIIVEAFARPLTNATRREIRDYRQQVEANVATLLGRIATVLSNGKV